MANVEGWGVSNFFAVKDRAAFDAWAADRDLKIYEGEGGTVQLTAENHESGWPNQLELPGAEDIVDVDIAEELQDHVEDGDAAILMEISVMGSASLNGQVTVVTPTGTTQEALWQVAMRLVNTVGVNRDVNMTFH